MKKQKLNTRFAYTATTLDDGETWGGPGRIVRMPASVQTKYGDDLDNGSLADVMKDPGTELLWVEGLVQIFDYLRKSKVRDPKLRKLMKGTLEFESFPGLVGEARPATR
jgi:hypothetical protein